MSEMHTNTTADTDKYILNGVEVTPNEFIDIVTNFLEAQQSRLRRRDARIAELEAAQRWIPVSESPKECEMRVFKDGNAWCFVLPDFQDLQVSPSVWMKKGVLDKIYKELRSVRDE